MLSENLDKDFCESLHENSITPISQYVRQLGQNKTLWVINLLGKYAVENVSDIIEQKNSYTLKNTGNIFSVKEISASVIQSEDFLLERAEKIQSATKLNMTILTPASFKSDKKYMLFPSEEHILKGLIRRWNSYSEKYAIADEDAEKALILGTKIAGYSLKSSYYELKGIKIPAFCGELRFSNKISPPIAELCKLLMCFAPYCGIGIKTSLGMGAVSVDFCEK